MFLQKVVFVYEKSFVVTCWIVKPKGSRWFHTVPFVEVLSGLADYVLRIGFNVAIVVCELV